MDREITIAWFSAGITSAVACKIALQTYSDVEIYYMKISTAHPDNDRFIKDCEQWYGKKINIIGRKNGDEYLNQFDIIDKTRAINFPDGAPCTKILKKEVRFDLERYLTPNLFSNDRIVRQVWGYEFKKKEINRALRHKQQYPEYNPVFPLIDKCLTKSDCLEIIRIAGIKVPKMYELGYNNNNCIGCVKGGKGYWNKIRVDFPEVFDQMSKKERQINHSCINGTFLDELEPTAGNHKTENLSCGIVCDLDMMDIDHPELKNYIK
jgi:hypothetical protein